MKEIIKIRGKANQVFKYVELLKSYKGNETIGELAKRNETLKLDFTT